LTVAANDLQYRHGAFREALDLWQDVQATAERYGTISFQAQACGQRMVLHLALGQFDLARDAEGRAAELVARLGPQGGGGGEPASLAAERATGFALYLEGDWPRIAALWGEALGGSFANGNYVTTLNGHLEAAMAALAYGRAGDVAGAIRLLAALLPILDALDPTASTQAQSGAVAFAADAAWIVGARDLAASLRPLALSVIAAGVGDCPQGSSELSVARMATLLGNLVEARDFFARARGVLDASGQRPLRAIVDHDEAVALTRLARGDAEAARLFEAAIVAFRDLGMVGWAERARVARAETAVGGVAVQLPAGLSEREAEVARLVARGYSDRQIADDLFISPRTVNAHIRNLLTKTNRINRTELAAWAVEHGIAAAGEE
jgi:DNA-binding CsgD family transcriptional regulator